MKTSFINNIFNSQPILIKFPLKFFSDTFTFDLRFPLKTRIYAPGDLRYKKMLDCVCLQEIDRFKCWLFFY